MANPTKTTRDKPIFFDDLPKNPTETPVSSPTPSTPVESEEAPLNFDDLPITAPAEPDANVPSINPLGTPQEGPATPEAPPVVNRAEAPSFDELPTNAPSQRVQNYLASHPATNFSLEAAPIASQELAKVGTVGEVPELSDRKREAEALKDQAVGFFNARMQQYFLDPEFRQMSREEQDSIIDAQISSWERAGLPAGKLNGANPQAWMGVDGKNTLRQAMQAYALELRNKGVGATAPGAVFTPTGELVVAQVPTMFGSESAAAAGLSLTRAIPGLFGSNIGGEIGAIGGEATGLPGGGIIGGVGGSILGALVGEEATRAAIDKYANEDFRNSLEQLDLATNMAEEAHPLAAWVGRAGGQLLHNKTGFTQILKGEGLGKALAPRLGGFFVGGGVEAASEIGRGDDLDPYKIAESAASGAVFSNPRYMGKTPPLTYEGRNWIDTNVPHAELQGRVQTLFENGAPPVEVLMKMENTLPDTVENRRALRQVSADIRHGRDPSENLAKIEFRPNGLTVARTIDIVNEHMKNWRNPPEVQVHDNYNSDTIPEHMREEIGPGYLGWKDENGVIHIVASQHYDGAAVIATAFHEGMHAGLVRVYQRELTNRLSDIYDKGNLNFRQARDRVEAQQEAKNRNWNKLSREEQKALVVDEVLASTAENGIHKGEFDTIASWIRAFARKNLGSMGQKIEYSDAEIRKILSTGHEAVSNGGMPSGDINSPVRYMNFGVRSRGADLEALHELGNDVPRAPERPGGWFESPADGEPRYEVSDKEASLKPDNEIARGQARLPDVLYHPTLFDAYPGLKYVRVKFDENPRANGSWSPRTRTIYLNPKADEPLQVLLHEVQHAVQDKEGWARGANSDTVYKTAPISAINTAIKQRIEDTDRRIYDLHDERAMLIEAKNDPETKRLRELYKVFNNIERTPENQGKIDAAYKEYTNARDAHRKSLGIDNPWDSGYHEMHYRAVQSERPLDWHINALEEDIRHYDNRNNELRSAEGNEAASRAAVKHQPSLAEMLYNRSGGEFEARATASRQGMTDEQRFNDPQFRRPDDRGVHPADIYRNLEIVPSSTVPAETRFSRKYSGSFPEGYLGRQERTENLIKNHFGNFSINNLKGMMRPLDQYTPITHEEIQQAAHDLQEQGFDVETAIARGAIPDHSDFVVALRNLVREKLDGASEIARRYKSSGGIRHERELMRAVTDLGQVMAVFDKTASNLGRMLHSLQIRLDRAKNDDAVVKLLNNVRFANGTLDAEALDNIATALASRSPLEIRRAMDKFDPSWKTYATSMFYNFLLGSPSVQLGNILGNSSHIVKAGVGEVLGYGVGLAREGVFQVGDKLGLDVKPVDRMHSDELMARASGLLSAILNKRTYDGTKAFNTAFKEFFIPAGQNQHENKFASQAIPNLPLSVGLEYGTRGLQAADAFFRTIVEHSAMQGLATREARRLNGGKAGNVDQIAALMANPTREMLSKVSDEADRIVFQEKPFRTAENFSRLMRDMPGGWIVAPIIRTPSNIGRAAIETFDPTGRATQRNREDLKANGPEADRVRGGQMLATALWAGVLYLMNNDMISGGGPTNSAARAQWLMSHVPYTIGNEETGRIPLKGISPIGDGLAMIADMREAEKYGMRDPEADWSDKALMVASGMSAAFLSNSFMSSVTTQLDRGMKPAMQNILGTLIQSAASVPVYSQIQKSSDPFIRDTSSEGSIVPSLAAKASLMDNPIAEHYIPGVKPRNELPIRRDIFGAPIMAAHPTSKDPVALEVGRLVDSTGKAVVPGFNRTQKGMHVPTDVYENFMAGAGPIMRSAVSQIMEDPVYKRATTDDQRAALIRSNKVLARIHARLNKQLQEKLLQRNPKFEGNFIPEDLKTISEIPGEN